MRDVAYVALGSNLGERDAYLARARAAIAALPETTVVGESRVEETDPLGPIAQPRFLNQMIAIETALTPRELLTHLRAIEDREGRQRSVRWGPRTLDLDIVRFDEQTMNAADLVVPHPELAHRPFWRRELAELTARDAASTPSVSLPPWAKVSPKRRAHIERVTTLLSAWADALHISTAEREAWLQAGTLHDALRDAPDAELRALTGDSTRDAEVLHGPAAATLLESLGEQNQSVLLAVRHHTVGSVEWDRVGRALYMADFLEPGRTFTRRDRAFLAAHAPHDFDGVFRQVLLARIEYALREGYALFPETVSLWNAVR